jgi:glycosyltransferase involved in cell wall biosynthesis
VAAGHSVEWFTAAFSGAADEEVMEGVRIVRRGRQWTVHWQAFRHYRGGLRDRFDVVVDEVNTIPFMTPLWSDIPTLLLIFQLAREVWWYEAPFPLSAIGFALEPWYLRPYRRLPTITISQSTSADLRGLGFTGRISIMPIGIEPAQEEQRKSVTPTFLYVGRLAPSKRIEDVIQAFAMIHRRRGSGKLVLVGEGTPTYVRSLRRMTRRMKVSDLVEFSGRLSAHEKHRRMAEASLLLMTSAREGWGLVITEANALGTPAVVYDAPGLRDAVRNGKTGLVVEPWPRALADGACRLLDDPVFYGSLVEQAKAWSSTFTFQRAAASMGTAISTLAGVGDPMVIRGNR